jgi:hypothetical protein
VDGRARADRGAALHLRAAAELAREDGILDALQLHGERRNEAPPGLIESARCTTADRSRLVQACSSARVVLAPPAQDLLEPEDERRAIHAICFELREELEAVTKLADEAAQLFGLQRALRSARLAARFAPRARAGGHALRSRCAAGGTQRRGERSQQD